MDQVEHHFADLSEARLHYVTAGKGEPVVLLHGWPQTWHCWKRLIPMLSADHRVIVPDLRGLGESVAKVQKFDKRAVAGDVVELITQKLGLEHFHLVGHDWGGVVAWAIAAHYPGPASTLTVIDVAIPGDGSPNISQGGARWHHAFHQTLELPETLISGRENIYLGWFYRNYGHRSDVIAQEDIDEYLRHYRNPSVLHAGFEYYRALPKDVEDNATRAREFRPTIPILGIGGGQSWGRRTQVAESLRRMADDVREVVIENAGHWVPEEQPEELAGLLRDFFSRPGNGLVATHREA